MRRLILRNFQSAGDIVMLTAAVRDLHRSYPGEFVTDVRTPFPDLWAHNPHITPLNEEDPGVTVIDCHYPLIDQSNATPCHFLHGFPAYLNDRLGLRIRVTDFKGDIHLSDEERTWISGLVNAGLQAEPYWLLVSGGKRDYSIKWWDPERYQRVVDHFAGRIQFVQVGEPSHHHPPLRHVADLRGQTSFEFVLVEFVERFLVVVRTLELLVFFRLVEFKLSFVVFELELAWLEQFVEFEQFFESRYRVGCAWGG